MQPSFLTSGDDPRRSDTRWLRWVRILSAYQNQAGASPANNAKRTDTIRTLKEKVLSAISGVAIPGCCGAVVLPAPEAENFENTELRWVWSDTDPAYWTILRADTEFGTYLNLGAVTGDNRSTAIGISGWFKIVGTSDGTIEITGRSNAVEFL